MTHNALPSQYQNIIHKTRYARWLDSEGRRENWDETCTRYIDFFKSYLKEKHGFEDDKIFEEIWENIYTTRVMPSMRALMTAGPALEREHVAGFNCSFVSMDNVRAFDEILYILSCGTGVGFSVERQFVSKLPEIPEEIYPTDTTIIVNDSKLGWAKAFKQLIAMLYAGEEPSWDVSKVRAKGERLKTFGGRASGPEPLVDLFKYTTSVFKKAKGRRLESIEVHDIVCKIGDVIVSGGVRRSALISLSNLSDQRMRDAKSGQWWEYDPQRGLANNSAAYTEKPEVGHFMEEWTALYNSKSGERGIFNRKAAEDQCKKFDRDHEHPFGTNPCGEIILRPFEFCNLSEVVARPTDTKESLKEKVRIATIIGTFQSALTDYGYIRKVWRNNCKEERLLGVSITGIMDCPLLNDHSDTQLPELLEELRDYTVEVNKQYAEILGIEPSAAITCVKPSGTVSQLVDSASGIHSRHSEYYIRRIRLDSKDPICQFMIDQGFPVEVDVMKDTNSVFSFPMKVGSESITRTDRTAIEELELWKIFKEHWCHHNPSVTISVRESEWPEVGAWVWNNFDLIGGLSFLPYSDHSYQQAPYEDCDQEQYLDLLAKIPTLDWEDMKNYESSDMTTSNKELACVAGSCEI